MVGGESEVKNKKFVNYSIKLFNHIKQ